MGLNNFLPLKMEDILERGSLLCFKVLIDTVI